jgi:pyruvate kinase
MVPEPGIRLEPGQAFSLTSQNVQGSGKGVSISYSKLPEEVKEGDPILLADGFIELVVKGVSREEIFCEVVTGGHLTSHKGLNLPTRSIQAPSLTEKDREDLLFVLDNDVDYIAQSFVRTAEEVASVKEIIQANEKDTPVIAKIEKHEAIDHIEEIIEVADGIMVARGDLGVEIPLEEVPIVQKMLIERANASGKPVITATQMLRSMVDSPRPTRAEATDVANAVLDGTDAVMLSEETAMGGYPVKALQFMTRIVKTAESHFPHARYLRVQPKKAVSQSVAYAACVLANHLDARAVIAPTQSGQTARHISRFRPRQPVIALSANERTVRRLTLCRGCQPRLVTDPMDTDDMIESAARSALETGLVSKGDLAVITAGHPVGAAGSTNMVRVKTL